MQTELSYEGKSRGVSPQLVVIDADQQQSLYKMTEGKSLLAGSGEACAIRLPPEDANLLHCMFRLSEGSLWVQDWNTDGKTLFNGTRLSEATRLTEFDELHIGSYRFTACMPATREPSSTNHVETFADEKIAESPGAQIDTTTSDQMPEIPVESSFQSNEKTVEQAEEFAFDDFCFTGGDALSQAFDEDTMPVSQSAGDHGSANDERNVNHDRNEVDMLRNEVVQLQTQLADKDNLLLQLCEENQFFGDCSTDIASNSQTETLVTRLEELLTELEGADSKVAALENQLHAAEHANQAELEERHQLESWVNQIEQRVLSRESELAAESEKLQDSLREERQKRTEVDAQLKHALKLGNGTSGDHAAKAMIEELRLRNADLENQLNETLSELESLKKKPQPADSQSDPVALREMQNRARTLESELASERAESARMKEQLARFQNDMEKRLNEVKQTADNESRVSAMKQHLRELHQEEKLEQQERFERSLGGRITKLWQKLDGR